MIEVNVKHLSHNTYKVQINPDASVMDLKNEIGK